MVVNTSTLSSEIIAHQIDGELRTAIGRTFRRWGRRRFLPPLEWSVEHWDGHVTLVGSPSPFRPGRHRAARRWAAALNMEPVAGNASRWSTSADGWHLEIHD